VYLFGVLAGPVMRQFMCVTVCVRVKGVRSAYTRCVNAVIACVLMHALVAGCMHG
jgi:hypothetical protein